MFHIFQVHWRKKDRTEIYNDFVDSNINVLIGTYSIFSEGLDITDITMIINCTANSGAIKSIQMLGRAIRLSGGKTKTYYYDFADQYKFLKYSSYKRKKH